MKRFIHSIVAFVAAEFSLKRLLLFTVIYITTLFSVALQAQTINCNSARDTVAIPGTVLSVTCPASGGTVTPPPVVIPQPAAGCAASQISTPLGGKTFQRQCAGSMTLYPSSVNYYGPLTDLSPLFGNKPFPSYLYSGQSPTFTVDAGYYISLAFTPQAAGLIKFTANTSYGDGGTISLSTSPGGLTSGASGVICAASYGGLNSLLISTSSGTCRVSVGQTYYINLADTNNNGDYLCFGGSTGACSESRVSYAFTARAQ